MDEYYDIPDASRYKMHKVGLRMFRVLKDGSLRELKSCLVIRKDGYRFRQVNIAFDDGTRRTVNLFSLYNKLLVLNGETPAGWLRSLPKGSDWSTSDSLSSDYHFNQHGEVFRERVSELGGVFFTQCHYSLDTTAGRTPIERVNIHSHELKPRTYTRAAIKKMWLARSGYINMNP